MKQHDVPKQCAYGLCGSKEPHLFFKINRLQCSETLSGFFVNSLVAWGEFLDLNRPLDIRRLCIRGESPTGDAVADMHRLHTAYRRPVQDSFRFFARP